MRLRAFHGIAVVMVLGALTSGLGTLNSAASAATPAAPTITFVVPVPATVTSPTTSFEVRIDGTTAAQDERGYGWDAYGTLVADGFKISIYGASAATVVQTRFLGRTAVFNLTPQYNGHYRITVENEDSSTTFEFDAAVPGLETLPPPPANVRVETDRLTLPVTGTTASFSFRFVSDEPIYSAQRPIESARADVSCPVCNFWGLPIVGNSTGWADVTMKWVDGTSATIDASFRTRGYAIEYTKAFPLTVGFAAADVFAAYPPIIDLSCPAAKARFTCTAALVNIGESKGLQVVPNQYTLVTETRTRVSPREFGPWRVISRVPANLNGEAVAIPVRWRGWANPRATLQIRIQVDGLPGVVAEESCPSGRC